MSGRDRLIRTTRLIRPMGDIFIPPRLSNGRSTNGCNTNCPILNRVYPTLIKSSDRLRGRTFTSTAAAPVKDLLINDHIPINNVEGVSTLDPLLVIIDLDETLFFSHLNPQSPHDFSIQVDRQEIFVSLRPGCKEFLKWCSEHFQTGLYSAGTESYAKALMDKIDPDGRLISKSNHRYRNSCWPVHYEVQINQKKVIQTLYTKDLSLFRKNLSRVVLIDNSLFSFMLQPDNGIPIADWRGVTPISSVELPTDSNKLPTIENDLTLVMSTSPASASGLSGGSGTPEEETDVDQMNKQTKDGSLKDGSSNDGSSNAGSLQDGSLKDGSLKDGSLKDGSSIDESEIKVSEIKAGVEREGDKVEEATGQQTTPDSQSTDHSITADKTSIINNEDQEKQKFGDFYLIKKTLEELKDVEDVKPILRSKYRLVDHIIRRCISGMITSSRL